jgi:hypothetical protein
LRSLETEDSSYRNLERTGGNPGVQHKFVADDHAKQAELKSGLVADLARFGRPICEVNVKGKPLEVASVEKKRKTA